jgi:hypothetical protein
VKIPRGDVVPLHDPSVSRRGNGLKLVDAVELSNSRELRAYVAFRNWVPTAIEIRLHKRARGASEKERTIVSYAFGFRPVSVPIAHVTDVQVLLARALDCARQPLKETPPYAEE